MAKMIGRKLHFVALSAELALGERHDACIIHEDVKRTIPSFDKGPHRLEVRQVKRANEDVLVPGCFLDLLGDGFTGFNVTDCQGDCGPGFGQGAGGFHSNPTGTACHDGSFASEVYACYDFHGDSGCPEGRSDSF
jgi:hypothetical protein